MSIALSIALTLVTLILVRVYRKQRILRHIFITSSDWCGEKIDEMVQSASYEIVESETAKACHNGRQIDERRAREAIPDVISDAMKEWRQQKNGFQAQLVRNGISQLNLDDLDLFAFTPNRLK